MFFRKNSAAPRAESNFSERFSDYLVPLVVLLALTALFRATDLDLTLSSFFYTPEAGWKYASASICTFLYNYGAWPGLALAVLAGITLALSLFRTNLSAYRKSAIFIILLVVIGPGLIVNLALKDNTGRPRPRDVRAFGGSSQFTKVLDPGGSEGQSFPSGHASMGFFLAAPYFILRKTIPGWAHAWLLFGLAYGCTMGIVRMAQGAHFASDVIWSWGIVHLCGLILANLLQIEKRRIRKLPLPA